MTRNTTLQSDARICRRIRSILGKVIISTTALVLSLGLSAYVYAQQRRPLEALREEFQRRATGTNLRTDDLGWILGVFVVLITLMILVSWLINRFQQRRPYFSHTLLFLELSWVHQLKLKDVLFLWKWTSQDRIRPRAQIFVDPALWQGKINPILAAAGSTIQQTEWDRLYGRLFGTLVPQNNLTESAGTSTANDINEPPA